MAAVHEQHTRMVLMINGVIDVVMALLLWLLRDIFGTPQAVGIAIGIYVAAAGWRMLVAGAPAPMSEAAQLSSNSSRPSIGLRQMTSSPD